MPLSVSSKGHLLQVASSPVSDEFILTSFNGEEAISSLFHYQVEGFSFNTALKPEQWIGKPFSFKIVLGNNSRYFHGYINQFEKGHLILQGARTYRLSLVPWLWFLTLGHDCRIYSKVSIKDIFSDIAKSFSFNEYLNLSHITHTPVEREYCVQYNETCFTYLTRLMEEEGLYYFFQHQENEHVLIVSDDITAYQALTIADEDSMKNVISDWQQVYNIYSGSQTSACYDFTRPDLTIMDNAKTKTALTQTKQYESYHYTDAFHAAVMTANQSKFKVQAEEASYEVINIKSEIINIASGYKMKLQMTEQMQQQSSYVIIAATFQAHDTTYFPDKDSEQQHYQNQFSCIPSTVVFRPKQKTPKPAMHGLQTALVTGPSGDEVYTDKYGRVKVQFHWDKKGKKDENSSCWIRVGQISAGKQWGALFIPRVGQEVIVGFIDGDPDNPLIIGSVYNANMLPPYAQPDQKLNSGIKTLASPKGDTTLANELRFEDEKGKEKLLLHANKDFNCVVENDTIIKTKNNETHDITHDHKMTIEKGNQSVTVSEGNQTINIKKGNRQVEVGAGDDSLTVKNNRSVTVQTGNDSNVIKMGNHNTKVNLGNSVTEAMQGIELKVGSNSIKIDQTGIKLTGLQIALNAQLSMKIAGVITEVNGSGMLKIQGTITLIN